MAEAALARGHAVTVFTTQWDGDRPAGLEVRFINVNAWTNHGAMRQFAEFFTAAAKDFTVTFAFNRFPGTDFYFAADNCLAVEMPKMHNSVTLSLLPRYWSFLSQERAVFTPMAATKIFYIAPRQKKDFMEQYHTQPERFIYLPPGIDVAFKRPADAESIRRRKRAELGINDGQYMLLLVGSDFLRKGGDLAIRALNALPEDLRAHTILFLAGKTDFRFCQQIADSLNILDQVIFLGGRTDVPELLLAADLLIHPARNEAAGTVLVESIAAGLPVLCTEECGFSNFVADTSGLVLPENGSQEELNQLLVTALTGLPEYRARTEKYALTADFYRRAEVAIEAIEQFAAQH